MTRVTVPTDANTLVVRNPRLCEKGMLVLPFCYSYYACGVYASTPGWARRLGTIMGENRRCVY